MWRTLIFANDFQIEKKIRPSYIFLYSLCFLFLFSCSEPQEFKQRKDLEVIPDLSGSIVYVEDYRGHFNSIHQFLLLKILISMLLPPVYFQIK